MATTLNLPTEGTIFRDAGDNTGSTLYQVKNGQLSSLAPGTFQAATDLRMPDGSIITGGSYTTQDIRRSGTPVNTGYTGVNGSAVNVGDWYNQQNGSGKYEALPTYNMADLNTALSKGFTLGSSSTFDINTDPSLAGYTNPNTPNPTTGLQQGAAQAASLGNTAPSPFGANYSPLGVPTNPTPANATGQMQGPQYYNPNAALQVPQAPNISSVGSSNIQSTNATTYQTPTSTPVAIPPQGSYTPAGTPVLEATSQENAMSDLSKKIMALNDQEAGKSQYQNEQNAANGVDTAQATKNSLVAQRQQILNAHAAAQLATQQGQGVTTAVDSRQRAEETRQSAIQELAVSSLIAAADGDLANAQALADKAVAKKFDPIEADLKAKMANLELIAKDPATSLQDKNRAMVAQAQLDAQKAAIAKAKDDASAILDIAGKAAANGANALTIKAIQQAATPAEAMQVAASQNALAKPQDQWSTPYMLGGDYVQKNAATGEIRTAVNVSSGTTGTGTAAERATKAVSDLQSHIVSGQRLTDGTPVIDGNGFMTPKAWLALIAQAPSEGLTRTQFIQQFGHFLYAPGGTVDSQYGLSPTEQKLITGALPTP